MASGDAFGYDQWPTLFLYNKLNILTLFYKVHTDDVLELLSKDIYIKRCNGHSERGKDYSLVPRFNTRYVHEGLIEVLGSNTVQS